jgi:hypothetical protein
MGSSKLREVYRCYYIQKVLFEFQRKYMEAYMSMSDEEFWTGYTGNQEGAKDASAFAAKLVPKSAPSESSDYAADYKKPKGLGSALAKLECVSTQIIIRSDGLFQVDSTAGPILFQSLQSAQEFIDNLNAKILELHPTAPVLLESVVPPPSVSGPTPYAAPVTIRKVERHTKKKRTIRKIAE